MKSHYGLPGAAFSKHFLNQMAVDAGAGLRFDLSVLILRTDFGFPLIKPKSTNTGIVDGVDYTNSGWHGSNMVFNLAIGYPF